MLPMNGLTLLAISLLTSIILSTSDLVETFQRACGNNASRTGLGGMTMAPNCSAACALAWLDTRELETSGLDDESRFVLASVALKCKADCPSAVKLVPMLAEVRKSSPRFVATWYFLRI
jgi:hypothetical protein